MPYFKNNAVNILFIHVPKTGGSSVEFYFSSKFNISLNAYSLFNIPSESTIPLAYDVFDTSLQHLTYRQLVQHKDVLNINFDNITIMTIVRNPYERIISDLFWSKQIDVTSSKEEVLIAIQQYLMSENSDNHSLPQHYFLTDNDNNLIPNIHVLHTETLTNDMKKMGYKDFNLFSNKNPQNVNYYNYLNNDSIQLINQYYYFDFVLFHYDQITI